MPLEDEDKAVGARASGLSSFTSQRVHHGGAAAGEESLRGPSSSSPTISIHRSFVHQGDATRQHDAAAHATMVSSQPLAPDDEILFPQGPSVQLVAKELKRCGFKVEESLALLKTACVPGSTRLRDVMRSYRGSFEGTSRPRCDEFLVGIFGLDKTNELRAPPGPPSKKKKKPTAAERRAAAGKKKEDDHQLPPDNFALLALLMEKGIVQPDVAAAILPHLKASDSSQARLSHKAGGGSKKRKSEEEEEEENMRIVTEAAAEAFFQASTHHGYQAGGPTDMRGYEVGGGGGGGGREGEGGGLDVPRVLGIILKLSSTDEGVEELMSGAHNAALGLTDDFEWTRDAVEYLKMTAETVAPFSIVQPA